MKTLSSPLTRSSSVANRQLSALRRAVTGLLVALCCVAALGSPASAAEGVVNINDADVETLQKLPRVGPAVAARIVEHRESNGKFREESDLLLVRGIGDKTFELLEPYISLEGPSTLNEKVRVPRQKVTGSDNEEADAAAGGGDDRG